MRTNLLIDASNESTLESQVIYNLHNQICIHVQVNDSLGNQELIDAFFCYAREDQLSRVTNIFLNAVDAHIDQFFSQLDGEPARVYGNRPPRSLGRDSHLRREQLCPGRPRDPQRQSRFGYKAG